MFSMLWQLAKHIKIVFVAHKRLQNHWIVSALPPCGNLEILLVVLCRNTTDPNAVHYAPWLLRSRLNATLQDVPEELQLGLVNVNCTLPGKFVTV